MSYILSEIKKYFFQKINKIVLEKTLVLLKKKNNNVKSLLSLKLIYQFNFINKYEKIKWLKVYKIY